MSIVQAFRPPTDTSIVQPFRPPNAHATHQELFHADWARRCLVRNTDPSEILISTAGACRHEESPSPQGGCGVYFGPSHLTVAHQLSFQLERDGPDGGHIPATKNRAEIRAVTAAFQWRPWRDDGVRRIVIATPSHHVFYAMTHLLSTWIGDGWTVADGQPVPDRDLWDALLDEMGVFLFDEGATVRTGTVLFWLVPRENNSAVTLAENGVHAFQSRAFLRTF